MIDKYSKTPTVQDLGGVLLLDTNHMGFTGTVGVYLLPAGDGSKSFAIVETGPGSTTNNLKKAIYEAGFDFDNLTHILVTHIHLDHAGAAGALSAQTGAKVYVHELGYRHMHDPTRLIASARRIYRDKMDMLWGDMVAIPKERLQALDGGDRLDILGHKISVIYTPGHANHHVSFVLEDGSIFTGDSAAIKFVGSSIIRPAFPPPELNLDIWPETVSKMLAAKPSRLLLTHFGEVKDAQGHLNALQARHDKWSNVVLEALRNGKETAEIIEIIKNVGEAELNEDNAPASVFERHAITSDYEMTTTALVRYWTKTHPEMLQ